MTELHPRMQGPATLLAISAAMQLLFVAGSLVWFAFNLLSGAIQAVVYDYPMEMLGITLGMSLWQGLTRLPQLALVISGSVTARGAYVAFRGGPQRALYFGAAAALTGPLLALFGSLCLWLSFDCIGFIVGGAGRVVLLVLGVLAFATTTSALGDPEVAASYAEQEPEWH